MKKIKYSILSDESASRFFLIFFNKKYTSYYKKA